MANGVTTNYLFKKRRLGHPIKDADIGENLDLIDTEIKTREDEITATETRISSLEGTTASVDTPDNTETTCGQVALDDLSAYYVSAIVVAKEDASDNVALYHLEGLFYRQAGDASQNGSTTSISTIEASANWDCSFNVDSTNVRVRVKGEAGKDIKWGSRILTKKVTTDT